MAATDPTKAASSSEIFSGTHTLAQIRGTHRSLHNQIEEKASRLRTQVGGSYRELLGTADTIVQMRLDNAHVQELLGRIGSRCGRGVVGSKVKGLVGFASRETEEGSRLRERARFQLLENCALVAGRVLRGGGAGAEELGKRVSSGDRLLLASKMLVLSRLLVKTVEEDGAAEGRTAGTALKASKRALATLRRRLTDGIERALKNTEKKEWEEEERAQEGEEDREATGRENLLKALGAYSLANSSGAKDVLQYFLRIRGQAIAEIFAQEEGIGRQTQTEDVVSSLNLYTRTITDLQALVPTKLSKALVALKKQPLMEDAVLKRLEVLRLDTYEKWCGEDVQQFTPFIRHDDLDGKYARDALFKWAASGRQVLARGLEDTLSHMADFQSIMDLRTQVLQIWIREGGRAKGFDPSEMQDDLREAINGHMLSVLEAKVAKLRLVGSEIRATLDSWQEGVTDEHRGLWEEASYGQALENGASFFMQEVVSRLYGRNDAVSKAITSYLSWHHVIGDVKEVVSKLRKQRWDNDYDEIEDEETIDARQQLLSQEDPQTLQNRLDQTLDRCFHDLEKDIKEARESRPERLNSGPIAMYILRILRDIRRKLPDRPGIKSFGLSMVPSLQATVVTHVLVPVVTDFAEKEDGGLPEKTVVGRPLWVGEPPLPNQASPGLFQFFRSLSIAMADAGVDLWSPAAVDILKKEMNQQLSKVWRKSFKEHMKGLVEKENKKTEEDGKEGAYDGGDEDENQKESGAEEGDKDDISSTAEVSNKEEEEQSPETLARELYSQWAFDLSIVEICLASGKTDAKDIKSLKEAVQEEAGLGADEKRRVAELAKEFWQRTSLLFGLLA